MSVETITISDTVRVRIEYDPDPDNPKDWGNLGEITYNSRSRYVLGTEPVEVDRFEEIGRKIMSGEYIGLPVWAYVHSGSTIRAGETNLFSCPWDSGRSGWVYTTREKVLDWFRVKRITKAIRERALDCLRGEVEAFDTYLRGEVYGYVTEELVDGEWQERDSCWGYYGLDDVRKAGTDSAMDLVEAPCTT